MYYLAKQSYLATQYRKRGNIIAISSAESSPNLYLVNISVFPTIELSSILAVLAWQTHKTTSKMMIPLTPI